MLLVSAYRPVFVLSLLELVLDLYAGRKVCSC